MTSDISTFTGIVLNAMPIGEYDKRISLLTTEQGKISVFLRGAKRPQSPMLSAGVPFSFGTFDVHEGRTANSCSKAHITEHFDKLKKDLTKTWYGSYFLEVAEYYAREYADEKERVVLLFQSLRALESEKFSPVFVRLIYDYKSLQLTGEYPNVFSCLSCKSEENLSYFSLEKRGCICENCKKTDVDIPISTSALYTLQFIYTTDAKRLFTFRLSESVCKELEHLWAMYRRRYFPHTFKSEAFLEL